MPDLGFPQCTTSPQSSNSKYEFLSCLILGIALWKDGKSRCLRFDCKLPKVSSMCETAAGEYNRLSQLPSRFSGMSRSHDASTYYRSDNQRESKVTNYLTHCGFSTGDDVKSTPSYPQFCTKWSDVSTIHNHTTSLAYSITHCEITSDPHRRTNPVISDSRT